MTTVVDHLLNCARDFDERAANPVVAWDCMGAETWAGICRHFAEEVRGLSDEQAIGYLKARRNTTRVGGAKDGKLPGWYMQMDFGSRMDEIIDPIARDKTGWIEMTTHGGMDDGKLSRRPGYRRMLGINHCVSFIGRKVGETDADWLARRAGWLGRYHPDIRVVRGVDAWKEGEKRESYTKRVGSVSQFMTMQHLVETGLAEGMHICYPNRTLLIIDAGPLKDPRAGHYSARVIGGSPLDIGSVLDTDHGRCVLVQ